MDEGVIGKNMLVVLPYVYCVVCRNKLIPGPIYLVTGLASLKSLFSSCSAHREKKFSENVISSCKGLHSPFRKIIFSSLYSTVKIKQDRNR